MAQEEMKLVLEFEGKNAKKKLKKFNKQLKDSGKQAGKTGKTFSDMKDKLKSVGIAAAAVSGGIFAIKKGLDFAREGANVDRIRTSFRNLSQEMDLTGDVVMDRLRASTQGLMSDFDLMQSATELMSLGLVDTQDQLIRMTTVAGELGFDMNQLVLTLSNMTTMRFDALGVSVDGFKERVAELEEQGLSAQEAFVEAFLMQAEEQVERVGSAADSAAGDFARMDAAMEDLQVGGSELALVLSNDLNIAGRTLVEWLTDAGRGANALTLGIDSLEVAQRESAIAAIEGGMSYREFNMSITDNLGPIEQLTFALFGMTKEQWEAVKATIEEEQALADLRQHGIIPTADAADDLAGSFSGITSETEDALGALQDYTDEALGLILINDMVGRSLEEGVPAEQVIGDARRMANAYGIDLPKGFQEAVRNHDEVQKAMDEGHSEADAYTIALHDLDTAIRTLPDNKHIRISLGITGGGGLSISDLLGPEISPQAHGGPLAPVALVGEEGPELIIDDFVIPADITEDLLGLGVTPGKRLAKGGEIISRDTSAFFLSSKGLSKSGTEVQRMSRSSGGGGTRSSGGTTTQVTAPQTAEVVVEQTAETVSQSVRQQVASQNRQLTAKVARMDRNQRRTNERLDRLIAIQLQKPTVEDSREIALESRDTSGF